MQTRNISIKRTHARTHTQTLYPPQMDILNVDSLRGYSHNTWHSRGMGGFTTVSPNDTIEGVNQSVTWHFINSNFPFWNEKLKMTSHKGRSVPVWPNETWRKKRSRMIWMAHNLSEGNPYFTSWECWERHLIANAPFRCQFHQHFTWAFFVQKYKSFSLIMFWHWRKHESTFACVNCWWNTPCSCCLRCS